jgi:hypothetical protein
MANTTIHPAPTLLYWNCNSILPHSNDIKSITCPPPSASLPSPPLFLAFVETKVVHQERLPRIPDYNWYMYPALSNHSGGIAVLVHESVAASIPTLPPLSNPTDATDSSAILWIELRRPHLSTFLLGVVYLQPSPSSSCIDRLEQSITAAADMDFPMLLVGDFNMRHTNWDSALERNNTPSTSAANRFASLLADKSLSVLNCFGSIAGMGTHKDSVLDLAITDDPTLATDLSFPPSALESHLHSDHRPLLLSLPPHHQSVPPAVPDTPVRIRWDTESMTPETWNEFGADLTSLLQERFPYSSLTLPTSDSSSNTQQQPLEVVTTANAVLEQCMMTAAHTHVTTKAVGNKYQKWWSYPGVAQAHIAYRQSFQTWCSNRTDSNYQAYSSARSQWKAIVKLAKQDAWKEMCATIQADPMSKIKWTVFKRTQPSSFAPLSSFRNAQTNALPADRKESLNNLSQAFADSAFPPPSSSLPVVMQTHQYRRDIQQQLHQHPSNDWSFSPADVKDQCRWQHTNTAAGADSILPLFFKHGGDELYNVLSLLYNYSWHHSVLPQAWRRANVAALYKGKGKRDVSTSFRPISVTSIIIRTFEHLLKHKLTQMATDSNIIHPHQFGFRKNHSTFDAIAHLQHLIRSSLKAKRAIPVAFLDLKKAFDRVWPERLIHVLSQAGIAGRAARWLLEFVTHREFRVVDQNTAADWTPVHYGVPQGCVLSPLLFILYINPVTDAIKQIQSKHNLTEPPAHIMLYADDIALVPNTALPNWHVYFQEALDFFSEWARANRMEFSQDKSQIVYFSRTNKRANTFCPHTFRLSGFNLEVVDSYCYLGLWHQSNMQWTVHANKMLAKARSDSYLISRIVYPPDPPYFAAVRALCVGYLRSRCTYALAFWKPSCSQLRKLQSAFVRPLLRVLSLPCNASHLGTLVEANTPSFSVYREYLLLRSLLRVHSLPSSHSSSSLHHQQSLNCDGNIPAKLISPSTESFRAFVAWGLIAPALTAQDPDATLQLYDLQQSLPKIAMQQTIKQWQASPLRDALDPPPLRSIKTAPGRTNYLYRPFLSTNPLRSRLRANRAFTQRYLHTTNRSPTDTCTHAACTSAHLPETVQHILLHCPRFNTARELLFDELVRLDPSLSLTLPLLLGNVQPNIVSVRDPSTGKSKAKTDWTKADAILTHTHTFLSAIQADFDSRDNRL